MNCTVGQWLDGDGSDSPPRSVRPTPPPPINPGGASSAVAISLCLTAPMARSWTPRQLEVFRTFGQLQIEEGVHSLLPGVMDAFVWIARQPWWDAQMAVLIDECE